MPEDLQAQITAEIERVQKEIDQQKALIKNYVDDPRKIEKAEHELRTLNTRLSRLQTNLAEEIAKN